MKLNINYFTKGGSSSSTTSSSSSSNLNNNKELKENMPVRIITIGVLDSGNLNIFNKWNNDIKKIIKSKIPNEIIISHYDGLNEIEADTESLNLDLIKDLSSEEIDYNKQAIINEEKENIKNCLRNCKHNFNFIEYDKFLKAQAIDDFDINKDNIYFKDFDKEELNNLKDENYLIFDFAHIFDIGEIKQYNIITLGYESINKDYLLNDCFKIIDNKIIIYSDIIFDKLILNNYQKNPFDEKYPDRFFEKYIPNNSDIKFYIFDKLEENLNLKNNYDLYSYYNLISILELGIIHNNLGEKIMNDLYEIYNFSGKTNYDTMFDHKYINPLINDLKTFT